jgi:hypothetical protein
MKEWLLQKFDAWALKTGRKYAMVDMFGVVSAYRYYIFYVEKHFDTSWKAKYLPNLFIHQFTGHDYPNGESQMGDANESHFHPWGTFSVILTGGYTEEIDHGKAVKDLYAPAVSLRSWNQSHKIVKMLPNTWTLFFHGMRRGNWAFSPKKHDMVCDNCVKYNNGICANASRERVEFKPWMGIPDSSKEREGWKELVWMKCDADYDKLIETRKRAMARKGIKRPETKEEWHTMFFDESVRMRIADKM